MIETPTVLVLGAGASCPYRFPTGEQLREAILKLVEPGLVMGDGYSAIRNYLRSNFDRDLIFQFHRDFNVSPRDSIDIFIEGRKEFSEIGRFAIASVLADYERSSELCGNSAIRDQDWLRVLFNSHLVTTGDRAEFNENKIAIITFNYDRSVEHRLTMDLYSTFGGDIEEAAEQVSKIEIIHVHGLLGGYLPGEARRTSYNSGKSIEELQYAASRISYFFEDGDQNRLKLIRSKLRSAKRVGFLGFGFNNVNLKRLLFPKDEGPLPETDREFALMNRRKMNSERRWAAEYVCGTTLNLAPVLQARAREAIGEIVDRPPVFANLTCREFLENTELFN
jgi:hypothetical protein